MVERMERIWCLTVSNLHWEGGNVESVHFQSCGHSHTEGNEFLFLVFHW